MDVHANDITAQEQARRDSRRHHLEWLGIRDGALIELQTLSPAKDGPGFVAFTTSIDGAVTLAENLTTRDKFTPERLRPFEYQGVYLVFNAHVEGMQYMIPNGEWRPTPKGLTTDERIAYRRAFYLDLDTKRPNDLPISATTEEVRATLARAKIVREDIKTELAAIGVEGPADTIAVMMSGNGDQDWFRLDNIPESPELRDMLRELLTIWGVLFDAPEAHVDTSVFDAKRIGPLAGTPKRKGSNTKERPHRYVTFKGSSTPRPLTFAELKGLLIRYRARLTPEQAEGLKAESKSAGAKTMAAAPAEPRDNSGLDVLRAANAIPIRDVGERLGLDREHPICPGCGSGGDGTDVAFLDARNLLNCKHARCSSRPNRTPVDLVAKIALGCDNIAGTKGVAREVLAWFETNFALKVPTRSAALDAILASDAEDVSMGSEPVGGATDDPPSDGSFSYTEDGNALRFIAAFGQQVIYVEKHESFYVWETTHWQKDPGRDRVVALMRGLARRMFEAALKIEDDKARGAAVAWALRSQSDKAIRAAVNLARTDTRIRVDADRLDSNPDLLSVQNGTFDFSQRPPTFREHRPDDSLTKIVPIAYDQNATCPEFERAIAATSDDAEVVRFRWRRFASYLDGHPDQFIVIAWGVPNTGKSTTHEEIAKVLGPHARKVPKSIFETTHHEQHPADLATLEGKRFVYGAEIRPNLNVDRINELTGDETVQGRGMRENWREIKHTWKMTFYSNKKPIIRADPQNGIWRRTIFDPSTNKIQNPKAPDEVKAVYARERQGILARLITAYAEYQEMGLAPPKSIMAATDKFKADQDKLKPFFDTHCDLTDKTAKTAFRDLWARYSAWMHDLEPDVKISKKRFALDLDAYGFAGEITEDNAKTAVRVGIKLRDVPAAREGASSGMSAVDQVTSDEVDRILAASERKVADQQLLEAV